jgi:hypothetical protein
MQSSTAWLGTFSDISTDPRPLKARDSLLNSGFRTMELLNKNEQIVSFSRLSSWSKMLFWGSLFRIGLLKELSVRNFLDARMRKPIILNQPNSKDDLILLFDIDLLPFVTHRLPLNPVILDFREIYTEQFGQDLKFRLFLRPIRKFVIERSTKSIGASYTVSRGLVSYYENEFGLKPDVIRSVPKFQKFVSASTSSQNIRIVYMGVAHPLRNLEKSAKMVVDSREDVEFHFYLVGDKNYIATLTRQCKNSSRIFFHPAVNFHAINETLTQYDLGWCYFIPETENLKNALQIILDIRVDIKQWWTL